MPRPAPPRSSGAPAPRTARRRPGGPRPRWRSPRQPARDARRRAPAGRAPYPSRNACSSAGSSRNCCTPSRDRSVRAGRRSARPRSMTLTTPSWTSQFRGCQSPWVGHQRRGRRRPRRDLGAQPRPRRRVRSGARCPARPAPCPGRRLEALVDDGQLPVEGRQQPTGLAIGVRVPLGGTPLDQHPREPAGDQQLGVAVGADERGRATDVGPGPQPLPVGAQLTGEVVVSGVARLDDVRLAVVPQPEHRRADQPPAEVRLDLVAGEPPLQQLPLARGEPVGSRGHRASLDSAAPAGAATRPDVGRGPPA